MLCFHLCKFFLLHIVFSSASCLFVDHLERPAPHSFLSTQMLQCFFHSAKSLDTPVPATLLWLFWSLRSASDCLCGQLVCFMPVSSTCPMRQTQFWNKRSSDQITRNFRTSWIPMLIFLWQETFRSTSAKLHCETSSRQWGPHGSENKRHPSKTVCMQCHDHCWRVETATDVGSWRPKFWSTQWACPWPEPTLQFAQHIQPSSATDCLHWFHGVISWQQAVDTTCSRQMACAIWQKTGVGNILPTGAMTIHTDCHDWNLICPPKRTAQHLDRGDRKWTNQNDLSVSFETKRENALQQPLSQLTKWSDFERWSSQRFSRHTIVTGNLFTATWIVLFGKTKQNWPCGINMAELGPHLFLWSLRRCRLSLRGDTGDCRGEAMSAVHSDKLHRQHWPDACSCHLLVGPGTAVCTLHNAKMGSEEVVVTIAFQSTHWLSNDVVPNLKCKGGNGSNKRWFSTREWQRQQKKRMDSRRRGGCCCCCCCCCAFMTSLESFPMMCPSADFQQATAANPACNKSPKVPMFSFLFFKNAERTCVSAATDFFGPEPNQWQVMAVKDICNKAAQPEDICQSATPLHLNKKDDSETKKKKKKNNDHDDSKAANSPNNFCCGAASLTCKIRQLPILLEADLHGPKWSPWPICFEEERQRQRQLKQKKKKIGEATNQPTKQRHNTMQFGWIFYPDCITQLWHLDNHRNPNQSSLTTLQLNVVANGNALLDIDFCNSGAHCPDFIKPTFESIQSHDPRCGDCTELQHNQQHPTRTTPILVPTSKQSYCITKPSNVCNN